MVAFEKVRLTASYFHHIWHITQPCLPKYKSLSPVTMKVFLIGQFYGFVSALNHCIARALLWHASGISVPSRLTHKEPQLRFRLKLDAQNDDWLMTVNRLSVIRHITETIHIIKLMLKPLMTFSSMPLGAGRPFKFMPTRRSKRIQCAYLERRPGVY